MRYNLGTYNISNNTLKGDNSFIKFEGNAYNNNNAGSWVKVENNLIADSNYEPIYVAEAFGDVSISNNVLDNLSKNQNYAINYSNTADYPTTLKVDNNTISAKRNGIQISHNYGLNDVSIANNIISRDQTYTVCCYYGVRASYISGEFENNQISDFAGGIYIKGSFDHPSRFNMTHNTITNNNQQNRSDFAGIYLDEYSQPVINYNNLDNNSIDLYNNTDASVYSEIDAKYNYWGGTTTASMDEGGNPKNLDAIYDSHDDSDKGFVNYGQWLSESYSP